MTDPQSDSEPEADAPVFTATVTRPLKRAYAEKSPALQGMINAALECDEDSLGSDDGEACDLSAYFAKFPHITSAAKIAMCRAYASMLASTVRANMLK